MFQADPSENVVFLQAFFIALDLCGSMWFYLVPVTHAAHVFASSRNQNPKDLDLIAVVEDIRSEVCRVLCAVWAGTPPNICWYVVLLTWS